MPIQTYIGSENTNSSGSTGLLILFSFCSPHLQYGIRTQNLHHDMKCSANVDLVLPVLQELQSNPKARVPARFGGYPITLEEYRYLLDLLPDLKDLRNIWGRRNRVEYLYLSQQLIIMLLPGGRHEAAITETAEWIMDPIREGKYEYKRRHNNLSSKDGKSWEWYDLLFNAGTAYIDCSEVFHCPDASFGSRNIGIRPLVLEVADSQKSKALSDLAMEYLSLCKGLIKYMFAVDIREVIHGADVDFIMWKHIKVGDKHMAEQCALHPPVRTDGTHVETTATISYPLSHILGDPPQGCDDLEVELRISDLIDKITSILPRKKFDRHNLENVKRDVAYPESYGDWKPTQN